MKTNRPLLTNGIHLVALVGYAVAQPVFDQVARTPVLLLICHAGPLEIVLLALSLSFGLPFLLLALEAIAPSQRQRRTVHLFFVAALITLAVLPLLARNLRLPSTMVLTLGGAIGLLATTAYQRLETVRGLCSVLVLSAPVFCAAFLWSPSIRELLRPSEFLVGKVAHPVPVVMVVFDEFSLTALLDESRQIDLRRFPNFARLAGKSTWYRNATTVASATESAVGSIVTGRLPPGQPDWTALRKSNLFTLLSNSHELRVTESFVPYCPLELCPDDSANGSQVGRLVGLSRDLAIVFLHLLVPGDLRSRLPELSNPVVLQDADQDPLSEEVHTKITRTRQIDEHRNAPLMHRAEVFTKFIDGISATSKQTLYYIHSLLPHEPSVFLPSGRLCLKDPLGDPERWGAGEHAVGEAYLHYLWQVQFVDGLIGKLLDKLDATGLLDESLLVVTADHGTSFRPGTVRRSFTTENLCDMMPVPLFIKSPGQKQGAVNDNNVEVIDVLPTIAASMAVPIPWVVDGQSVLESSEQTSRVHKTLRGPLSTNEVPFFSGGSTVLRPPELPLKCLDLDEKRRLVALGSTGELLLAEEPFGRYVGLPLTETEIGDELPLVTFIENSGLYEHLDPNSTVLPCVVSGEISTAEGTSPSHPLQVAIAVNGRIGGITAAAPASPGTGPLRFAASVPEGFFRTGYNEVQVFGLDDHSLQRARLSEIPAGVRASFALQTTSDTVQIEAGARKIVVLPAGARGAIYEVSSSRVGTRIRGWAGDAEYDAPAAMVLLFRNGRFLHLGHTDEERPELAREHGVSLSRRGGFEYQLPASGDDGPESTVRVFAVSANDTAKELKLEPPVIPSRFLIDPTKMRPELGHAYLVDLPPEWAEFSSSVSRQARHQLDLRENGEVLGPANSAHALIRKSGAGAHSHWVTSLYFSASDNSDPRTNGRVYEIEIRSSK